MRGSAQRARSIALAHARPRDIRESTRSCKLFGERPVALRLRIYAEASSPVIRLRACAGRPSCVLAVRPYSQARPLPSRSRR